MTIKNQPSIGQINRNFTTAPARSISKRVDFEQIIVVLDGDRKSERILPHALNVAREHQAELLIVHTYPTQAQEHVNLYLKAIKNKLKTEYGAVQAYVSDAIDEFTALTSVVDSEKQTCVVVAMDRRNWLQRLLSGTLFGDLANKENVHLYEVDLSR